MVDIELAALESKEELMEDLQKLADEDDQAEPSVDAKVSELKSVKEDAVINAVPHRRSKRQI